MRNLGFGDMYVVVVVEGNELIATAGGVFVCESKLSSKSLAGNE